MKQKQADELLELAKDRFQRCHDAEYENREDMLDDLKFANLDQWPDEVKNERADKPMLTLDHTGQHVRQIVGDLRMNKPAIKVRPVDDDSDRDAAEIREGLIRHIETRTPARRAYVWAAECAVKMGYGVFRILTEYVDDDSFDQEVRVARIRNPFTVYFDPTSEELTREDARYAFVTKFITGKEFEAKYPYATAADIANRSQGDRDALWWQDDAVRLAEYFVKEPVTKEVGLLTTGEVVYLDDLSDAALATYQQNGVGIVKRRTVDTHKVMWYLLSGMDVLEGPIEFPSRYIPLVPVYGEEADIEGKVEFRGIIRAAKDPQRMYNYWRTTGVEMLALQPKQPYVVTPEQIQGFEGMWKAANKANLPYLVYNPDPQAPGPPSRQAPPNPNPAVFAEASAAAADIQAATGLYNPSLGAGSNETSGRAILARERQADTGTFLYIDNLSAAIEYAGRIFVDMIPRVYDTERSVRILGEDDKEKIQRVNGATGKDITKGRYDVRIVTGPSYATKRIEAADSMMKFVAAVPQAGQVAADLIADSMDWPGADRIAGRLAKLVPPGLDDISDDDPQAQQKRAAMAQAQQLQMQQAQLAMREKAAEIAKTEAEAADKAASAQLKQQELQTKDDQLAGLIQTAVAAALAQVIPRPTPGVPTGGNNPPDEVLP